MRAAIATGIAFCLAVVPVTSVRAASPSAEPLPAKADPDAQVQALYELGIERFQAAEYDEALIMWKRAFVLLPYDHAQQATRAALVINIVAAHRSAYESGRNPEHLAEAMRVIDLRKAELLQLYAMDDAAVPELASLEIEHEELGRLHAIALNEGEVSRSLPVGTAFRIEPAPPPELTPKQVDMAVATDPAVGLHFRKAKGMADSGIVVLSIGGAALTVATIFAATYDPYANDGAGDSLLPILIPAGVVVSTAIVGGTLLGIGSKRKKQAREGYRARQSPTGMVVPISLPLGGGLGFVGRF